jgi:ribosomal-protein-alanine N-acetyltransferase
MQLTDVPEVSTLEQRVFTDPWSVDSFVAEVERKPEIGFPLVLRDGDELVGYAVVWFIVDEIHIGNIAVHPAHQRRGHASSLLEYVLDEGRRRSMAFATLEVRPSNEAAIALYERYGFTRIAVRKAYYRDNREDALVLACPLTAQAERRF